MVEIIEAALDVALYNPSVRQPAPSAVLIAFVRQESQADVLQGAVRAPSGSEPVGDVPELRLEDRLQKRLDRALNDAILDRGNAQRSDLPWFTGLGDEFAPRRAWSICAGAQFVLKLFEEALLTDPAPDAAHGHPVDPRRAAASI